MLVNLLKETNKENRIFRGEVIESIEVYAGLCRILLKDEIGDLIYCLIQGMQWFDKIKNITHGQKIILAPSKIIKVTSKYKNFYTPDIKGKNVSDLYFHYNIYDFDLGINIEYSEKKPVQGFYPINEIFQWLDEKKNVKCSVIGVLVDFYMKNSRLNENYYRLKVLDESSEGRNILTINLNLPKMYLLKNITLGDIIVAQNLKFIKKEGYYSGIHNYLSGSFAILSSIDCKVLFCLRAFILSENIIQSACILQNWIFNSFQYLPQKTVCVSRLSYLNSMIAYDIILYLIQILNEFPESGNSTLIFSDTYIMGYLTLSAFLISHLKCNSWVKLSSVKYNNRKIEAYEYSSIIGIPIWNSLIKCLNIPTSVAIKQALAEFSEKIGQDSYVNACTKHSQERCMDVASLISLTDLTPYTKIKAIIIDFQPRIIGAGIVKKKGSNNSYSYSGLIKVWIDFEILTLLVCGKNSELFYGIASYDDYAEVLKKVERIQESLCKGYGWIELGIKRIMTEEKVILSISETEIKSYS